MFVPVKSKDGQQLMPMHAARARKLVKRKEATPYFDNGIYCIRLSLEGKRLCQNAKIQDFKVLTRINFNYRSGVSSPE